MSAPPRLFDRASLRLHQSRARTLAVIRPGADFLLDQACDDLAMRLAAVSRPFPVAADLYTLDARAAAVLADPHRAVTRVAAPWATSESEADLADDPDALPFAEGALDLVVSLLALQVCDDLPGVFAQVRRALRPDGLFLACFLGGRTLHELRGVLAQAETETIGGISPRVIPFVDLRDAGGLLQRAGFALPVTDVDTLTVRYDSLFALAADLRAMGAANPLVERSRHFSRRATILKAAQLYAERFADADGRIRATFDLVWVSGWAPHESQQKPLAPGSAKRSLAEALGSKAIGVSDGPNGDI